MKKRIYLRLLNTQLYLAEGATSASDTTYKIESAERITERGVKAFDSDGIVRLFGHWFELVQVSDNGHVTTLFNWQIP